LQSSQAVLPTWYRAVAILFGLITVGLALLVLADPVLGVAALIFLLAFALLVMGVDRIIAGITGHPFGWMPAGMRGLSGVGPSSGPSLPDERTPPPR
jgi:uncharacterized membrane protein HdeD (DUF308 family)